MNIGDNKHVVRCADADKLFQILMNRLKIGEPGWLVDPISTLTMQADRIKDSEDPEVVKAVARFRARVAHIKEASRRPEPKMDEFDALRMAGRYHEVLHRLSSIPDVDADPGLLAIRATTNFNLVQEAGTASRAMGEDEKGRLRDAITDLKKLASDAESSKRLEAHRQLFEALMLSSDEAGDNGALSEIIERADGDLYADGREGDVVAVRLLVAQARQQRADQVGGEGEDVETHLRLAADDFEAVLDMLAGWPRDHRWAECKDGLATTLQRLGELEFAKGGADVEAAGLHKLQQAFGHLQDVLLLDVGGRSPEQAGRLRNLAATIASRARMDTKTRLSLQDARSHLRQAIDIYRTQDDANDYVKQTEKELNDLRSVPAA